MRLSSAGGASPLVVVNYGRGIGAGITRPLAGDAWEVVAGARSREQVETVADDIDEAGQGRNAVNHQDRTRLQLNDTVFASGANCDTAKRVDKPVF